MSKKDSELEWLNRELMLSPYCYALCLDEKSPASEQETYSIQRIALSLMISYRDQMLAKEDKKKGKK